MTLATFLGADWQTLADAFGLGGIYALMAVGIGLVFGVLRLINFAYGQLVMAGAYSLAFAYERGWPVWVGILLCFGVVVALSIAMDWVVFRPLRTQAPAVMLVTTFAIAFLLQSIALLWFGSLGKIAASLSSLNQPWTIGGVDVRKISIVSAAVAAGCLIVLVLLLGRTAVGLQMRAAALDFRTARLLGVRANRVIGSAGVLLRPPAPTGALSVSGRDTARNPRLRVARHDPRVSRGRPGWDEPPRLGDAGRLRDRVRRRLPRRGAADQSEPVPAVLPVRGGDSRAAGPPGGSLHPRQPAG